MSWPARFIDHDGPDALILVPSRKALIQDLGPFLSGIHMETDIAPRSALVCRADADGRPILQGGKIPFAFEGNVYNAVNLTRFGERCILAAWRLKTRYPSISYGAAAPEDLTPIARFDLDRMVFTEIIDPDILEGWSGETAEEVMPALLSTPCTDVEAMKHLFDMRLSVLCMEPDKRMAWKAPNGQVIIQERDPDTTTLWSVTDAGFRDHKARELNIPNEEWQAIFGRYNMPDWAKAVDFDDEDPSFS
jgi:hypothetical protein